MDGTFYIGQYFTQNYPADAAIWCVHNSAYIEEIWPGRYQIKSLLKLKEDKK